MKKKHSNFRKLHFLATLVEFIKETISDRGNQPTNYRKLSTQLIKKKKKTHTHIKTGKTIIILYTLQIWEILEFLASEF